LERAFAARLLLPQSHVILAGVGLFIRIAKEKRARLEPSERSQSVTHAIGAVVVNSYDILKLSGQKSSAVLSQLRSCSRRFDVVALPVERTNCLPPSLTQGL
jgi:hypothetical protein